MNLPDSVTRVLHTFWQSFGGALIAAWFASGIDLNDALTSLDAAKKVGLAVLAAIGSAALSAAKNTITSLRGPKSEVTEEDDPDPDDDIDPAPMASGPVTASAAKAAAEPASKDADTGKHVGA